MRRFKPLVLNGEVIPVERVRVAIDGGEPLRLDRLAAAISSLDWVSSHDRLGRNDPTRAEARPQKIDRSR